MVIDIATSYLSLGVNIDDFVFQPIHITIKDNKWVVLVMQIIIKS